MRKEVAVFFGAGSIGQAIIRRVGTGKHVILADYNIENANRAARILGDAGFECSTVRADLGSKDDILSVVAESAKWGEVKYVVNAAGVSPSQAPVSNILRVDMYGTSLLLEEFGKVIAEVGDLAEFLMSSRGRFISGTDILIDGGTTASYWYGDLQYLKSTH